MTDKNSPYDCKHFAWMPGMVSLPDEKGRTWRRVAWDPCFVQEGDGLRDPAIGVSYTSLQPNWHDPGSWGCLLALLRKAYSDTNMTVGRSGGGWQVIASAATLPSAAIGPWPSDVDAMRKALEAAP